MINSGTTTIAFYGLSKSLLASLDGSTVTSNQLLLGDDFDTKPQADAAKRLFSKEFCLLEKSAAANDSRDSVLSLVPRNTLERK